MAAFVGLIALMGKGDAGATWRGQIKVFIIGTLIFGGVLIGAWIMRDPNQP